MTPESLSNSTWDYSEKCLIERPGASALVLTLTSLDGMMIATDVRLALHHLPIFLLFLSLCDLLDLVAQ